MNHHQNHDSKFGPPNYAGATPTPNSMNPEHQPPAAAHGGGPPPQYSNMSPSGTPGYLVAPPPRKPSSVDCMQIVNLVLRISFLIFSFIGFMLIVTIKDFDEIDALSYQVAMSALAFLYGAFQIVKAVVGIVSGKNIIPERISAVMDFISDQLFAYLLMSAASAGSAATMLVKDQDRGWDRYEEGLAQSGAASSMVFFAFVSVAVSTLMSIHKLFELRSRQQKQQVIQA